MKTFVCTFENDESSCLLTSVEYSADSSTKTGTWDIVDGREVISDNTFGSGLSMNNIHAQTYIYLYQTIDINRETTDTLMTLI